MIRQSISLTSPNDDWLKAQVESQEYVSKSEVVNDLIREARQREIERKAICAELLIAEQSGFTDLTAEEIRQTAKKKLKANDLRPENQ